MDSTSTNSVPTSLRPRHRPTSVNILQILLRNLKHLDLTGRIKDIEPVLKAHGGYCDVFTGFVELEGYGKVKVAVKRLRTHILSDQDFARVLARELRVWSSLRHQNILPLLGYFSEGNDYPVLVSEWMENNTALSYIKKNPNCDVLSMVLGIAGGLSYLHERNIIHADMKADNVLISSSGRPLICDFGISHIITASQTYARGSCQNGVGGSVRWMSTELLEIKEEPAMHSKQSDVWAFGMTIYELLVKKVPFYTIGNDIQVLWAIIQGTLPIAPIDLQSWPPYQQEVWSLCHQCWRRNPLDRISASGSVEVMSEICEMARQERLRHSRMLAIIEELEKIAVDLIYPNPHDLGFSKARAQQPEDYLRMSTSVSLHLDGHLEGSRCEDDYSPPQQECEDSYVLSTEMPENVDYGACFPLLAPGRPHNRHSIDVITRLVDNCNGDASDDSDASSITLAQSTTSGMTLASGSDTDNAPSSSTRCAKLYRMKRDSVVNVSSPSEEPDIAETHGIRGIITRTLGITRRVSSKA